MSVGEFTARALSGELWAVPGDLCDIGDLPRYREDRCYVYGIRDGDAVKIGKTVRPKRMTRPPCAVTS